jgi:hypothetical protein
MDEEGATVAIVSWTEFKIGSPFNENDELYFWQDHTEWSGYTEDETDGGVNL